MKRKSVANGRKKSMGQKKTRAKGEKTGETPNPNRDKLKKWSKNMGFVFFKAVQGFKQNNIVHQQPQSQIASVQRLQPIPDASIGRALAEKTVFFVVFDRHSRAIADWEFPIAVALRSSSSKITHDHAIRICATPIAIAIATFGALSKAMAILLFRG